MITIKIRWQTLILSVGGILVIGMMLKSPFGTLTNSAWSLITTDWQAAGTATLFGFILYLVYEVTFGKKSKEDKKQHNEKNGNKPHFSQPQHQNRG